MLNSYKNFTLSGSLAFLDFEFEEFPNAECFFGQPPNSPDFPGLCDISGQGRRYTPDIQANIGLQYTRTVAENLLFNSMLDVFYSEDYFLTPQLDPIMVQDAFTRINARLSLGASDGAWEISLLGKNLTDESIATFGNRLPVSGTLTGGQASGFFAAFDRPRTVALQMILRF